MLALLLAAAAAAATPRPPSGVDIARASNVVWRDPSWAGPAGPDDGSGALPIGNGDVAAPVWVDPLTGDLRLLLRKSDVRTTSTSFWATSERHLRSVPPPHTRCGVCSIL